MRKHSDLKRRNPTRQPKALLVLFCEGEKTEPDYLNGLNRHWGSKVLLDFRDCGTDPKGIVSAAADLKKSSKRLGKSDPNEKIEEIWCLFDRDQHEKIPEALQQAETNKISVAYTNPCFELWLLLHFQDQTAHLERDEASRLCRSYMPGYTKSPDMALLLPRLPDAERRAEALCNRQTRNERTRSNPWTDVHQLIQTIRNLSAQ